MAEQEGLVPMSEVRAATTGRSTLLSAEPQLFVADLRAACDFYTERLGFTVAFTFREPPFYGQVSRDAAKLNLRQLDEPPIPRKLRDREHLLAASITVDDVGPLSREFEASGVPFHQQLKTEAWGANTFIVRDLDGNLLLFAGRS